MSCQDNLLKLILCLCGPPYPSGFGRYGIQCANACYATGSRLYNARAAGKADWLANAHRTLDEAVFSAYGWPPNLTDQEILARLLDLNHHRAAQQESASGTKAGSEAVPKHLA